MNLDYQVCKYYVNLTAQRKVINLINNITDQPAKVQTKSWVLIVMTPVETMEAIKVDSDIQC